MDTSTETHVHQCRTCGMDFECFNDTCEFNGDCEPCENENDEQDS